jgi:predicted nucleic acid-binding protein
MIIDASVMLSAFFPDEAQANAQAIIRDHTGGRIKLKAPTLLIYEICNAVWQAERRNRIQREQADQIIQVVHDLEIDLIPLNWGEMMPFARQYDRSAYDAAYLALAQRENEPFVTGDERLFRAVQGQLNWVFWIEDRINQ